MQITWTNQCTQGSMRLWKMELRSPSVAGSNPFNVVYESLQSKPNERSHIGTWVAFWCESNPNYFLNRKVTSFDVVCWIYCWNLMRKTIPSLKNTQKTSCRKLLPSQSLALGASCLYLTMVCQSLSTEGITKERHSLHMHSKMMQSGQMTIPFPFCLCHTAYEATMKNDDELKDDDDVED